MQQRRQPASVLLLHGSAGGYGADRQLYLIAAGLDPSRYRPLVVLPERGPLASHLEAAGIEVLYVPLAIFRRRLLRGRGVVTTVALRARNASALAAVARRRRVAIVHSNSSIILSGQAIARRAGLPHLLHLREIYHGAGGRSGDRLWPLLRARLLRADAIACISEAVAAQVAGSERAFLLHDAVPRDFSLPSREEARRALRLDRDRFVVAMVGRISDWKGQDVFLRALAEPVLSEIGAVGLVAGDSAPDQRHFEHDLASLAERLSLDGRLSLLGFRDDLAPVLAAADAVVVPSRHADSFPNAALEAAAAGVPVVAAAVGGLPEIVQDGVTGRLVPPGDAVSLGAVLRQLAEDPAYASSLGRAAGADVTSRFGRDAMLETLQERYDRLLASHRRVALLVATRELAVSQPAAPQLRLGRMGDWLRGLGYDVSVESSAPLRRLLPLTLRALRRPPSVLLTNTPVCAPLLALLRLLRGKRVFVVADVMGLHSLEIEQASGRAWRPALRRLWMLLEAVLCLSADLVLAVNDRHAAIVRHRYRPDDVVTLRDAAEAGLGTTAPADRGTLGIPADVVAVGFVGSLVYGRLEPAFAAWERLVADGSPEPPCLVVVGDGPDLDRYRRRAREAGWLGRSVVFLGSLPRAEAMAALRACDIAYSDCWSEAGFPAKLFEYMALGLPIVVEGKRQIAEVLTDGDDAVFFRTPAELAAAIRSLAAGPGRRRALGAAARATLGSKHTVERRRDEFETLVERIPSGAGGATASRALTRARPRLISVVVPVRNEERFIEDQLAALAAQEYAGAWELVVVDNGCTDRSIEVVRKWSDRFPSVRIVDASSRPGLNAARNAGARAANGDFLAFCDADDAVGSGWLAALANAAPTADLVGGVEDVTALNSTAVREWLRGMSLGGLHYGGHGFLPYVSGGNCGVWADVARDVGWDESFSFGSSDIEFAWRVQLASYRIAVVPEAVLHRRVQTRSATLARRRFSYGYSEPQLYRRFRRAGMERSSVLLALQQWGGLLGTAFHLFRSGERRDRWLRTAAIRSGRLAGSVRWRVVFL